MPDCAVLQLITLSPLNWESVSEMLRVYGRWSSVLNWSAFGIIWLGLQNLINAWQLSTAIMMRLACVGSKQRRSEDRVPAFRFVFLMTPPSNALLSSFVLQSLALPANLFCMKLLISFASSAIDIEHNMEFSLGIVASVSFDLASVIKCVNKL